MAMNANDIEKLIKAGIPDADVTITLTTAGFYTKAEEFFDGKTTEHELTDPRALTYRTGLK